jgi:acetyl esterase/lipase
MPVALGNRGDAAPSDGVIHVDDGPPGPDDRGAHVDLRAATAVQEESGCVIAVRGRGIDGIRWAAHSLIARTTLPPTTKAYGALRDQVGDLRLPEGAGLHPVVVLVHGGGWRELFERDIMDPLAVDLTRRGYATWNLEYRRVGPSGGGWPQTADDVGAGVDAVAQLADRYPLDPKRVAVLGHSAGGHLAVCAASGRTVAALFVLSGALDLEEIGARGTGDGSGIAFMGGLPHELPDAYAAASPLGRLPLAPRRQLVAYGTSERIDLIDGNRRYCARARELSDDVQELVLRGADHFSVIDPRTLAWQAIAREIERIFPS